MLVCSSYANIYIYTYIHTLEIFGIRLTSNYRSFPSKIKRDSNPSSLNFRAITKSLSLSFYLQIFQSNNATNWQKLKARVSFIVLSPRLASPRLEIRWDPFSVKSHVETRREDRGNINEKRRRNGFDRNNDTRVDMNFNDTRIKVARDRV